MFDKAYESYKLKCKELGIKPSPKVEIFGEDISKDKKEKHVNIQTLSQSKKVKAPALSETAKKALVPKQKKRASTRVKKDKKQLFRDKIRTAKREEKVKKPKVSKPKRVLQTEDEKRLKRNAQSRSYYHKTKPKPKPKKETVKKTVTPKPPRVLLTDEEKKEKIKATSTKYYEKNKEILRKKSQEYYDKNKDKINAKQKVIRASKPQRILLDDDEKKIRCREKARLHYLKNKDNPEYKLRRKENREKWKKNNKDKIAAANKRWRENTRTPEQLEEKRIKQRAYRQKNLEKIRAQDRGRKEQRKDYIKNNPEAHEKKKARERERYAENMQDSTKAEKLREKWRHDSKRKSKRAAA